MFEVKIKNLQGEIGWQANFKTIEEAQLWANKYTGKPGRAEILIKDLSQDPEWVKKDIELKRKSEFPTLEEKIDALILSKRGDDSKLIELIQKIEAIEIKYPEPTKEIK